MSQLNTTKEDLYKNTLPQAEALLLNEPNLIANLSNLCALLHNTFGFLWTGFYLVEGQELVLGPFQGPVACNRIGKGKGVCGTSWLNQKPILVEDVHAFEGHIACNGESNSEVVVPLYKDNQIIGVLDIDSKEFGMFDNTDVFYLEKMLSLISK
ncbi:MAG: L-methionine (R)-S-oxide reductase [Bacteroidia bacterium]|jgi:L-methionine (R)-S-oxide reductase